MKIKSLLIAICALVISFSAFSQESTKSKHHHSTEMHHKKHHKHMKKEDSKADRKKDKKEKSKREKKMNEKEETTK